MVFKILAMLMAVIGICLVFELTPDSITDGLLKVLKPKGTIAARSAALRGGSLFGLKFMLYDVKKEVPYDEDTYRHGGMRMIAVATNVETGKPAYFEKGKTDFDFNEAVRASASLPLASTPVMLDGQPYLDGGCSCPIALNWALKQGFDKIVVVTTRQKGFRKSQPGQRMVDLYDDFYGDKPLFLATMLTQELRYNALMDELDELEQNGRIYCLRPQEPITISRFEGNVDTLTELYARGHREGRHQSRREKTL